MPEARLIMSDDGVVPVRDVEGAIRAKLHIHGPEIAACRFDQWREVFKGEAESVQVGSRAAVTVTIARGGADTITKEATVNSPLIAPIAAGAAVGQYTVRVGDEVVARVPLVALQKVEKAGIWGRTIDSIKLWFED